MRWKVGGEFLLFLTYWVFQIFYMLDPISATCYFLPFTWTHNVGFLVSCHHSCAHKAHDHALDHCIPLCNLSALSKMIEKVVLEQFISDVCWVQAKLLYVSACSHLCHWDCRGSPVQKLGFLSRPAGAYWKLPYRGTPSGTALRGRRNYLNLDRNVFFDIFPSVAEVRIKDCSVFTAVMFSF